MITTASKEAAKLPPKRRTFARKSVRVSSGMFNKKATTIKSKNNDNK